MKSYLKRQPVAEISCLHGISDATFGIWHA